MKAGYRGTFVIPWAQTEVDGLTRPEVDTIGVGAEKALDRARGSR